MAVEEILNSFWEGEVVDNHQIEELKRWQLLDFVPEPEEDYVSEAPIVIVCGCGRSGTTLTRVMLDSHPQLYSGPESLLFLPVPIDTADLAYKFELARSELEAVREQAGSRARFIDAFQSSLIRTYGKPFWADKTARNVHRLDYIRAHFPRARIIHMVRDPRDVVASLKTHRKRKLENGKLAPTGYYMPFELCVARWELAINDALKHHGTANFYEVRYEDLVFEPEKSIREICRFLEVDYDGAMLDFHKVESPTRNYLKFPQNVEATQPLSTSRVGRYRESLTAEEIENVEQRLRSHMEHYGYAVPRMGTASVGLAHQSARRRPIKIITDEEVEMVIGSDVLQVKQWIREALQAHHEGKFIQPQKSYLFTTDNPYDRIISLPAAFLGDPRLLGVKWIGSHSKNCDRGLDRAHAIIILNDPETHAAAVVMEGTLISSARTLAVSLIVIDQFAPRPRRVGVIGMGKLGRMHARVLGGLYPSIERINCFSARAQFDDLLDNPQIRQCASPQEVVADSEVIVTVGAPTRPYLGESELGPDVRLIVNLSLLDFELPVIVNSNHIVVDDWLQNTRAEKVFKTGVDQGLITRDRVFELAEVLFGPRRVYEGRVFVNPIGMGLEDVYVAAQVARRLGVTFPPASSGDNTGTVAPERGRAA